MKVKDLIAELQKYPADAEVELLAPYDGNMCAAGGPVSGVHENMGKVIIESDDE